MQAWSRPWTVVEDGDDLFLVMEYVEGESLAALLRRANERGHGAVPPAIAAAVARDWLSGLHAAHETVDDEARPLAIIHRDVSPSNILVGTDGSRACSTSASRKHGAVR